MPSPTQVAPSARRRALVLESDRLIKSLIVEWLQMAGYESVCVCNPEAVVEISDRCDLVLADVPAPLKSARETLARLAQALPGTPVIAMSADISARDRSACDALARELGAAAVLVKPFSQEALLYAIQRTRA